MDSSVALTSTPRRPLCVLGRNHLRSLDIVDELNPVGTQGRARLLLAVAPEVLVLGELAVDGDGPTLGDVLRNGRCS